MTTATKATGAATIGGALLSYAVQRIELVAGFRGAQVVRAQASGGTLTVSASDGLVQAQVSVPLIQEATFDVAIPSDRLVPVVRALAGADEITLDMDENRLSAAHVSYRVPTVSIPTDDMLQVITGTIDALGNTSDSADIVRGIQRVSFAVGSVAMAPEYQQVLIGDGLVVAYCGEALQTVNIPETEGGTAVTVPAAAMDALVRFLRTVRGPINYGLVPDGSAVEFRAPDGSVFAYRPSRALFPEVGLVLDEAARLAELSVELSVKRMQLIDALNAVRVVQSSARHPLVTFTLPSIIGEDLVVRSALDDASEATSSLPVQVGGCSDHGVGTFTVALMDVLNMVTAVPDDEGDLVLVVSSRRHLVNDRTRPLLQVRTADSLGVLAQAQGVGI